MQGKGNLFYWQCKPCNTIIRNASKKHYQFIIVLAYKFKLDHKEGIAAPIPHCSKCKQPVRPNINLKEDLGWIDLRAVKEDEEFQKWFEPNRLRSLTILEIGCGPVQPLGK